MRASLLISFFDVGRQTQQYFDVSSPSSRRENNPIHKSNHKIELGEVSYVSKRDLEERKSFKGSWSLLTFC